MPTDLLLQEIPSELVFLLVGLPGFEPGTS
jgi:hypothetical protein